MPLKAARLIAIAKQSGPILSRLWPNVHEILGNVGELCIFQRFVRLSVSCFVQKIFAIKYQSRRKTEQMQKF